MFGSILKTLKTFKNSKVGQGILNNLPLMGSVASGVMGLNEINNSRRNAYLSPGQAQRYMNVYQEQGFKPYANFVDQMMTTPLTNITSGIGDGFLGNLASQYQRRNKLDASTLSFLQNRNNGLGRTLSGIGTGNLLRQQYAGLSDLMGRFGEADLNYRMNQVNAKLGMLGQNAQIYGGAMGGLLQGVNNSKSFANVYNQAIPFWGGLTSTLFNMGMGRYIGNNMLEQLKNYFKK